MSVESVTSDKQQPPPPLPPTVTITPTITTTTATTASTATTPPITTTTTTTTAVTAAATAATKKEEGDEAIISMSVAGEVTDASIVEVGRSRPQFQYSREDLMLIKNLRLSRRRPTFLDIAYNNSRGVWDPERWHSDRKRSDTPPKEERTGRGDQITENHSKRRNNGDPRDRIRKEQDGIVLSPQRRSFNSGCFVNVNQPPNRRPESPIGKPEVSHREPVRRIGSGRILTRDIWDFRAENEKIDSDRADYGFRSSTAAGGSLRDRDNRDNRDGKERDRDRDMRERERDRDNLRERDERFERRSFGRDYGDRGERERDRGDRGVERNERNNHQMERDKDRGREKRFSNDRRRTYSDNRDSDEPEWFSSGPTSQHDTIELRGFEDIPEEKVVSSGNTKSKKQTAAQKKRGKRNATEKEDKSNENSAGPKGRSTPNVMDQPINAVPAPHSPITEQTEQSIIQNKENDVSESTEPTSESGENSGANQNQEGSHPDFNLDEFLKSDTFPGVSGLLTNGVGSNSGTGSRFSQWFKRESPVQQVDSRRTSIQDELLNNLLNDITEPNIQIPSVTESNTYFAPISPANTTNNANTTTNGVKLLEMLHRGNKPNQNGQGDASNTIPMMKNCSIKDLEVGGKVVHSLEELEARMRGGAPPPATSTDALRVNKTEDLSAFKKLLAQVTGGQAVPAANGPITHKQPVTLMQLLNSQLKTQQSSMPHQQPPAESIHTTTFNHVGPLGPTQHPHQVQMQHENLMKVLQIQQQQQQQQQQHHQQQQQQQQKQQQQQQRHSDMLSMMMGNQRMLGVSPVPAEMQMMINNVPSSQELLQRPEAQAIIQGLQQGEITRQHLIQQLNNPAMQHRHREVLANILKMYGGTTPRTISPHPHSAAPIPQEHILQQMLYQQQQQRIPSPMNNAYCPPPIISPNLTTNPSTLTVQHPAVIPHRVPSPREIVMHTQSIMQSALIKKKLEEQRENFRKRQDQQQQQQQQQVQQQRTSSPVNSPAKQTASPLAFTPTSVLRKMTADKEPDGSSNEPPKLSTQTQASQMQQMQSAAVQLLAQGALSRHTALRSQPIQSTWSNPSLKQHPGRPIVKGNNSNTNSNQFQYNTGNAEFQQQHRTVPNVYGNPARSKHTMATSLPHHNAPQYNIAQNSIMNQRSNPMNTQMKTQQVPTHLANMQQPPPHGTVNMQQPSQRTINTPMQLVMSQNYNSNRTDGQTMRSQQLNMAVGRQPSPGLGFVGSNGGDLSPTSNQLARWFSPELLAQARAGKLPELAQTNVLSLEELERLQHASTIVHN
ncbi:PREDICTED: mastermind-like protein 3 [Cyphomyrmex costatus]|uniref:mastermind-like protein 3 n=1 Tax=Cyphomyrmex costatus TaxID=456900 RepID=UPI000852382A|nr:PREDICTED: mastermind-like protein 3 [Cyphomyrmex costatus]